MSRLIALFTAFFLAASPASAEKRIALTFDDVPSTRGAFFTPDDRTKRLIASLIQARVKQTAFFVTPGNLNSPDGVGGAKRIDAYVHAGHVIANHSFSHRHLSMSAADEYIADIDRAEIWLKGHKGRRPWFRFPYLDEGGVDKVKRDALRDALKARRLTNGYVTADGADWNLEALTVKAARSGKSMDMVALRNLYVETMVQAAEFNEKLMRQSTGRSPVHVILLHETDLAALFIPAMVAQLRQAGWMIVTADEAFADPISRATPDVPSARGTLTEAFAWEKGLPAPRWYERADPSVAARLFAGRVLKEQMPADK